MDDTAAQPAIALTVDLEDWYHSILGIEPADWSRYQDRVVPATETLLEILARGGARATFFVLGHVAELHPQLVPKIAAAGHEIACHGYAHRLVYRLTHDEFRADLRRALDVLRSQTEQPIRGYRAAYWSITRACTWALDIVAEEGLTYDSSIYPTDMGMYGIADAPRDPFRLTTRQGRQLLEFPPSVLRFPLRNVPFAGGIYLRVLPLPIVDWALQRFARSGRHALVYIHPPEFDPDKPRLPLPVGERLLHYARLDAFRKKIPRLVEKFRFAPVGEILDSLSQRGWLGAWTSP